MGSRIGLDAQGLEGSGHAPLRHALECEGHDQRQGHGRDSGIGEESGQAGRKGCRLRPTFQEIGSRAFRDDDRASVVHEVDLSMKW